MTTVIFKEEFASTFEAMAGTLDRAINVLRERDLITEREVPCTRLCLEEALVNAIRHGNGCDAERKVSLEMGCNGTSCSIRVCDEGGGFNPERVALPECDQLGGRGICLIKHYMDHVRFDQTENCLEMRFRPRALCTD